MVHLAAIGDELRALRLGSVDVFHEFLLALAANHRSERRTRVSAGTDFQFRRVIGEFADQGVTDLADPDGDAARQAALAGIAEGRRDDVRRRELEVRVVHDQDVVLGTPERLHPLSVGRRRGVDVGGHRRRADERDRRDIGMGQQLVDRIVGAVYDVEDARGQARLLEQLGDAHRRERRELGWL